MPEYVTDQVGGRVVPFGSFLLGVHSRCSDIDALCVGLGFIERHNFFSSFSEKLRSLKEVQDIWVIEEAFVPVINLTFERIQIDLVYARVMRKSISDRLDLLDTTLLQGMDVQSVRSLQGYRVTKEILSLVPNVHNFRLALRAIKHWAKCRHIYSNKLGFLGGVAWSILVARVCQLYPNASAATLVAKFFLVFSMWEWPIPLMLRHPEAYGYNFPVWDPRESGPMSCQCEMHSKTTVKMKIDMVNPRDRFHQMPIITPTLRLLVGILERNASISRAHPSVQSFPGKDGLSTKWLIGVQFNQNGPKKLDLTPDLLAFSQTVYSQSESIYKDGMDISAAYENLSHFLFALVIDSLTDEVRQESPWTTMFVDYIDL